MPRDYAAYLTDVLVAGKDIITFTETMTYDDYLESGLVQAAVERKFGIIGDAVNELIKMRPDLRGRIHEERDLIAFRNRIIHGYFSIDEKLIWSAVKSNLPRLLSDAQALLDEQQP